MTKFGNSEFANKPTNYYNLDIIISVGYLVKSQNEKIKICGKDCKHRLVNNYGKPIYVISLKICYNVPEKGNLEY